ncbi:ABC transporter permease [Pelosinus sp. UFO1]|uniref:ABC transporter permease n=1 Tax=Pelosinus sp. UFO1 TaxID=484770 RepID=UPI0004D1DD24|nr:ABC transporter permease [Pelosinus sp. UFO1]AIF53001.1 ABC-type transporter, integral membrane subunit [Pelosinus sp. UFO1]
MLEKTISENTIHQKITTIWTDFSVFFAFLVITIMAIFANDLFFTSTNLMNIARQVSVIGIISMGMTLVILSSGIDLSVGSVLALTGIVTIKVLNSTGSVIVAVLVGLAFAAFSGLINGVLITKGKVPPFIATLGVYASARSLALYINNGGNISGKVVGYISIANDELMGISYPAYFFLAITILMYLFTQKTRYGRYIYAIGSNENAARLSAINVNVVKCFTYIICGLTVGLASIVESSRLNSISSAASGYGYEMDAIAAVIIGGTRMSGGKGTIVGTFLGVLILGIINNMLNLMNVSPYLQGMCKGLIILVAVLMQKKD